MLPGCPLNHRRVELVAGTTVQPGPHRARGTLYQARHALRRQLGALAYPVADIVQPLPPTLDVMPQPALLLDRLVHLPHSVNDVALNTGAARYISIGPIH